MTPLPEAKASLLTNEDALLKLITDKSVDVVAIVAGQPAKLFADMKPEVRQFIKMLKFDAEPAGEQGGAQDLLPGDGSRQRSYSESAERGHSRRSRSRRTSCTYDYNLKDTRAIWRSSRDRYARTSRRCRHQGIRSGRRSSSRCPIRARGGPTIRRRRRNCASASRQSRSREPKCTLENTVLGLCPEVARCKPRSISADRDRDSERRGGTPPCRFNAAATPWRASALRQPAAASSSAAI